MVVAVFVVMAALSVVAAIVQQHLSSRAQTELRGRFAGMVGQLTATERVLYQVFNVSSDTKKGVDELRANAQSVRQISQAHPITPPQGTSRTHSSALSPEIREALRDQLSVYSGDATVRAVIGNDKSLRLANDLAAILRAASWRVDGVGLGVFATPIDGIIIQVRSATTPGAALLQRSLKSIGIEAEGAISDDSPPDKVSIIVGTLPD